MQRYEVVKTSALKNNALAYRVTSLETGRSYTVEKGKSRDWKCECRGFWDGIRKGDDDPHCGHIKACIGRTKSKPAVQPRRKPPEAEDVPFEAPSCTACGATERTKAGTKGGKQVYRLQVLQQEVRAHRTGISEEQVSPERRGRLAQHADVRRVVPQGGGERQLLASGCGCRTPPYSTGRKSTPR